MVLLNKNIAVAVTVYEKNKYAKNKDIVSILLDLYTIQYSLLGADTQIKTLNRELVTGVEALIAESPALFLKNITYRHFFKALYLDQEQIFISERECIKKGWVYNLWDQTISLHNFRDKHDKIQFLESCKIDLPLLFFVTFSFQAVQPYGGKVTVEKRSCIFFVRDAKILLSNCLRGRDRVPNQLSFEIESTDGIYHARFEYDTFFKTYSWHNLTSKYDNWTYLNKLNINETLTNEPKFLMGSLFRSAKKEMLNLQNKWTAKKKTNYLNLCFGSLCRKK